MNIKYKHWIFKFIPNKKFIGLTLGNNVFFRHDKVSGYVIRHEYIHTLQFKKYGYIKFFYLYFKDWIKGLLIYRNFNDAYLNIKLEAEAYAYQRLTIEEIDKLYE